MVSDLTPDEIARRAAALLEDEVLNMAFSRATETAVKNWLEGPRTVEAHEQCWHDAWAAGIIERELKILKSSGPLRRGGAE